MTTVYVDATTLLALGTHGSLDLLDPIGDPLVVLESVAHEVTTEPARTNLERYRTSAAVSNQTPIDPADTLAKDVLDESTINGDVRLIAHVLAHRTADSPVGIVSDDKRVRRVADGFGATVTGTIGVLVRAVEDGMDEVSARRLLDDMADHGLHMTVELRDRAEELLEDASS